MGVTYRPSPARATSSSNVADPGSSTRLLVPTAGGLLYEARSALAVVETDRLAFWDAMLWATARRIGVRYLMTEDLRTQQDEMFRRYSQEHGEEFVAYVKKQAVQTVLEFDTKRVEVTDDWALVNKTPSPNVEVRLTEIVPRGLRDGREYPAVLGLAVHGELAGTYMRMEAALDVLQQSAEGTQREESCPHWPRDRASDDGTMNGRQAPERPNRCRALWGDPSSLQRVENSARRDGSIAPVRRPSAPHAGPLGDQFRAKVADLALQGRAHQRRCNRWHERVWVSAEDHSTALEDVDPHDRIAI